MNNDSTTLKGNRGRRDSVSRSIARTRGDKATSRHRKAVALLDRVARDLDNLDRTLGAAKTNGPAAWRIQQASKFVSQARDILSQLAAVELGAGAAKVIYGSSRR